MADTPQAEQVVARHGGVAHEVAAQGAALERHAQIIFRQGEVVHADVLVAGAVECLDGQLHHGHALGLVGQILALDEALGPEAFGQVGVAVDGHATREQLRNAAQGAAEAVERLFGQAVDEVDVDGFEVQRVGVFHQRHNHFFGLDAVDGHLYLGVQVLHAQADAVEPHLPDVGQPGVVDGARVHLDRAFGVLLQADGVVQRAQQLGQLVVAEEGGGAATQVQLRNAHILVKMGGVEGDFLLERMKIGLGTGVVPRADAVAGAVVADRFAERDVDIHRDGLPRLAQRAVVQPPGLLLGIERFGKVVGRGVGGIPRSRLVEDANLLKCRHGIHV